MKNQSQQQFTDSARRFLELSGIHSFPEPNEDSLRQLYKAFSQLPYENVSKIIGSRNSDEPSFVSPRFRTPEEVLEGFVQSRLGGTCFSLTNCLFTLLKHCGFNCWRVLGDMAHGPNIHCAVVVGLGDHKYLCDAGYLLPEPIILPDNGYTKLTGQIYRYILKAEPDQAMCYSLFTESPTGGDSRWRYRIREQAVDSSTFEHYWAKSFTASMNSQLILSHSTGESHVYVHKHSIRRTTGQGRYNENVRGRVGETVQEIFGIDSSLVERAWELSERAKGKHSGERR